MGRFVYLLISTDPNDSTETTTEYPNLQTAEWYQDREENAGRVTRIEEWDKHLKAQTKV